jgi:hypothetical protein
MIDAIAILIPALLILPTGVRAEKHAAWFETGVQLEQDARQLLARDMEKSGVGENAIEKVLRKVEHKEILPPHFAAGRAPSQ